MGVPAAREDDALRACREAVEMRDALRELRIAGRIGVNTGEVMTGWNLEIENKLAKQIESYVG